MILSRRHVAASSNRAASSISRYALAGFFSRPIYMTSGANLFNIN